MYSCSAAATAAAAAVLARVYESQRALPCVCVCVCVYARVCVYRCLPSQESKKAAAGMGENITGGSGGRNEQDVRPELGSILGSLSLSRQTGFDSLVVLAAACFIASSSSLVNKLQAGYSVPSSRTLKRLSRHLPASGTDTMELNV